MKEKMIRILFFTLFSIAILIFASFLIPIVTAIYPEYILIFGREFDMSYFIIGIVLVILIPILIYMILPKEVNKKRSFKY